MSNEPTAEPGYTGVVRQECGGGDNNNNDWVDTSMMMLQCIHCTRQRERKTVERMDGRITGPVCMHSFSTSGWTAWGEHGCGWWGEGLLELQRTGLAFFPEPPPLLLLLLFGSLEKKCGKIIFVFFRFFFIFFFAACYIKWKLQLLFIGLLQMIWSRSRIVERHPLPSGSTTILTRCMWQPFGV